MHDQGRVFRRFPLLILLLLTGATAASPPAASTEIMPVDEIRVGMRGYGLTVFHGDRIEPFAVEVVSVMRDFAPQQSAIWIRCLDERLQKTGPISGMSGSPIYLWPIGREGRFGRGGKLIGAFAFGFNGATDCYAGVQPIEQMLAVAKRARTGKKDDNAGAKKRAGGREAMATLNAVIDAATRLGADDATLENARWLRDLVSPDDEPSDASPATPQRPRLPLPDPIATQSVEPMRPALPLPSQAMAELFGPRLRSLGFRPVVSSGAVTGNPPPGVDPRSIRLRPGSVAAVALAFGDMDLSAVGTVTDVLDDGRTLAFGHAMFGQGDLSLPYAAGYVHLVMPTRSTSFKLGGSAILRGTLVRDENAAIVSMPVEDYRLAPLSVEVTYPEIPKRSYTYKAANHDALTPIIVAVLSMQSAGAERQMPRRNTTRFNLEATFEGGRTIRFGRVMPSVDPMVIAMNVLPPITVMMDNPFESLELESAKVSVEIDDEVKLWQILTAWTDGAYVEPGETIQVYVKLRPHGEEPIIRQVPFDVPEDLRDGAYQLMVSSGQVYLRRKRNARKHLSYITSVDDLVTGINDLSNVDDRTLHLSMTIAQGGLAVERTAMPMLPSSKTAMIVRSGRKPVAPIERLEHAAYEMPAIIDGARTITLNVKRDAGKFPDG